MENQPYLIAAYAAILIILAGYVVRMHLRERSLRRQMDALKQELGRT